MCRTWAYAALEMLEGTRCTTKADMWVPCCHVLALSLLPPFLSMSAHQHQDSLPVRHSLAHARACLLLKQCPDAGNAELEQEQAYMLGTEHEAGVEHHERTAPTPGRANVARFTLQCELCCLGPVVQNLACPVLSSVHPDRCW